MDKCSQACGGIRSLFQQYNLFGDACSVPQGTICQVDNTPTILMSKGLVDEEWTRETVPALTRYLLNPSLENFAEVADGIVDTVYVLMQLSRVLGIPFDKVWDEVQQANLAKVGPEGKVIRREDGKILKPEGWQAPKVWDVCYAEYVLQMKKSQAHQQGEVLGDPK